MNSNRKENSSETIDYSHMPKELLEIKIEALENYFKNPIKMQKEHIKNDPAAYAHKCDGKVMATLFYEPSTRTQMSFQTAMIRLGGQIIGFDNPANSSVSKGETIKDTTKIVSNYADILVIRHPIAGAAKADFLFCNTNLFHFISGF